MFPVRVLGAAVLAVAVAQPISAQDKALAISLRGGGFNSLTNLDDAGTADFKKIGYNAGGGVGVELNERIALRGDFTFARNELQLNSAATGSELNRFFVDLAVQFQHPTANGWKPYLFIGAGAVTLDPVGASVTSKRTGVATTGLGLQYRIPDSNLAVMVEGKSWIYDFSEVGGNLAGYDKAQFDVTWSAGFAYRVPIGRRRA